MQQVFGGNPTTGVGRQDAVLHRFQVGLHHVERGAQLVRDIGHHLAVLPF